MRKQLQTGTLVLLIVIVTFVLIGIAALAYHLYLQEQREARLRAVDRLTQAGPRESPLRTSAGTIA
jgi:uncharacterized protein YpmB